MTTKLRLSGFLFLSTFLCVTQAMAVDAPKIAGFSADRARALVCRRQNHRGTKSQPK